jgi:uncharacterized repeat protein (TIGR03843 family)
LAPETQPTVEPEESSTLHITEKDVLKTLSKGKVKEQGLLPYSSNHSFLITVSDEQSTLPAVYKPRRGESPLWDFEWGSLCLRETAAYLVSQSLGWDLVPPTVLREGTRGIGSIQFYVDNEDDQHYFTVQEDARFTPTVRRLALFDFIINNADRKSGHCLIGTDERLWAIDHGICFHTEYKLRTVIWEFSKEPIESELLANISDFAANLIDSTSQLSQSLCALLNEEERAALLARTKILLQTRIYPSPLGHRRNYPWPPI